ncbi:MAG: phosphoenolpyruvate carboxykinase [Firmicutes bacterium]|nr:phosphoenolpyruvate carboxykinase [Bacillota bacterium]
MSLTEIAWLPRQVIMHTGDQVCSTTRELLSSPLFRETVHNFISRLRRKESPLLDIFEEPGSEPRSDKTEAKTEARSNKAKVGEFAEASFAEKEEILISLLQALGAFPLEQAARSVPGATQFTRNPGLLHEFVEELYNYWRRFDRFVICYSETGIGGGLDARPYRTFNDTIEQLTDLVRAAYRDICENITGDHPRVYRQVAAGAQVGVIAVPKAWPCPGGCYTILEDIPFIRQILIDPPLIIDPPMNKRTGQFEKVDENPLDGMVLKRGEWLCYPAQVGPLVMFIYFHRRFMGLGCSLANLFEIASDDQIAQGPDAIYTFGAPPESMERFGDLPTVFHEDQANQILVAAVPCEDKFGYFGYLKKMILTLHNILVMKKFRRMPFHGAMTRIVLKNGMTANVLIIGDTATGKSESLEAFRVLGEEYIRQLHVIADDMGSLEIGPEGCIKGYGTEIGAFVRLDDLQPGYAFDQIDRAIIMSPQKTNARAVMPVTTMEEVLHGHPVDYLLYANNYEEVDELHPIIERFNDVEEALAVFRDGAAMAKGTTTSTGLVHSYFANIFGPPQYRDLHEELARSTFEAAFKAGVFIGQVRTRLGIPGYEIKGPELAARALFDLITLK